MDIVTLFSRVVGDQGEEEGNMFARAGVTVVFGMLVGRVQTKGVEK